MLRDNPALERREIVKFFRWYGPPVLGRDLRRRRAAMRNLSVLTIQPQNKVIAFAFSDRLGRVGDAAVVDQGGAGFKRKFSQRGVKPDR